MSLARLVITAVIVEGRSKSELARDYGVSRVWLQQLVVCSSTESHTDMQSAGLTTNPRHRPTWLTGTPRTPIGVRTAGGATLRRESRSRSQSWWTASSLSTTVSGVLRAVREAEVRKVLLSVLGGLLGAAVLISPAYAVKPVIVEEETIGFDETPVVDPELSEACGFPVTVSTKGHIR